MLVYFDNAATTSLDERVFEEMRPYFLQHFGNPSSIHRHGREVRSAIEKARRNVARIFNVSPAEVFFTSGATEADNTFLAGAISAFGISHIISSPIEHHAVLHTVQHLAKSGLVKLHLLHVDKSGKIDLSELQSYLAKHPRALVSLMHGNNELGNILDIASIANLCSEYEAIFHSDTVQTVASIPLDLQQINVHSIVGSAHKFHGPKGIGFLIMKSGFHVQPVFYGGGQERNMRGGTEYVAGIIGLAKALELAVVEREANIAHTAMLKERLKAGLSQAVEGIRFLGDAENSLSHILNVAFPDIDDNDMLLFNLDINGISVSGGSACSSGTSIGSHVLKSIVLPDNYGAIRFSFSHYNTIDEVDFVIKTIISQNG
ncbi:MAG: cysteine desulfurase family protein [Cyclobacteriaceae bacterium]